MNNPARYIPDIVSAVCRYVKINLKPPISPKRGEKKSEKCCS